MKCIRLLPLVVFFLLDVADFIMDWLVYHDANEMESGLVYGPPSQHVVRAYLAFCIIGTVTFIVEAVVLIMECREMAIDPFPDVMSAVIVWLEDIPQVVISFSVALCRQDAISVFQISKAGVVILGGIIRLIAAIIRGCKLWNKDPVKYIRRARTAFVIGMLIEIGFSVTIFLMNYANRDSRGGLNFRVPTTIIEERYDSSPFFENVSLFIEHSDLLKSGNIYSEDRGPQWLRLFSINNLRENGGRLSFNTEYQYSSEEVVNLPIWVRGSSSNSQSQWEVSGCYTINQTSTKITTHPKFACVNTTFFGQNPSRLFTSFQFEEPDTDAFTRKRPIGEIFFNMRNEEFGNGCCLGRKAAINLHYFQVNATVDPKSARHFLKETSNSPRFFRNVDSDMMDVKSVWKTGWSKCPTTGSTSPVLDKDIEVKCEKMPRGDQEL